MATHNVDFDNSEDWGVIDETPTREQETAEQSAGTAEASDDTSTTDSDALAELETALSKNRPDGAESNTRSTGDDGAKESEQLETKVESEPDERFLKQFESAFEKRFGVSVDDIIAILGGADELVREASLAKQERELRQFWGQDYDTNFALVLEKFKQLPPELQEKYDNVEGAKLLWAIVQKEQGTVNGKKLVPQRDSVKFMRGAQTPANGGSSTMWKLSEILELSAQEYAKNLPDIEAAFRENRVIRDV